MGTSHSTPGPLIDVYAPGSHWKVPYGSFAFETQPSSRAFNGPQYRGPVYTPCPSPRQHVRPRNRRPRYNPADLGILGEDEDSETELGEMMDRMNPRGLRSQGTRAYLGARGGGEGYFDGMDMRSRSAPDIPPGVYPGRSGMGLNKPNPGMVGMPGMGRLPSGMHSPNGYSAGAKGGMGGMQPSGQPPEYTTNPSLPGFSGGMGVAGMPGPAVNPYTSYPGHATSSSSLASPTQAQATHQAAERPSRSRVQMPIAADADADKPQRPSRTRTEIQTSAHLNHAQPLNKRVGPSSDEWTEGNAWLDACVCTTNCKCRKGQRVLYRARRDRRKNSESNDDGSDHESGEIRFILKDELGRDCGDHSRCKKSDSKSESESKSEKKKRKSNKKEKKSKQQLEGFKEDLLDALDVRLRNMEKKNEQQGQPETCPQLPFGRSAIDPRIFVMNTGNMDPHVAHQMRMMGDDSYNVSMPRMRQMPSGMMNQAGQRPSGLPGMSMGGMAAADMIFEDEVSSADMDDTSPIGMGNPSTSPDMMRRKSLRSELVSPRRARNRNRFRAERLNKDADSRTLNCRDMTSGEDTLGGRRLRAGSALRQPHVDFELNNFDPGHQRRLGKGRPRDEQDDDLDLRGGAGVAEDRLPTTRRHALSPVRRGNAGHVHPDQWRQPHADTDDDDVY